MPGSSLTAHSTASTENNSTETRQSSTASRQLDRPRRTGTWSQPRQASTGSTGKASTAARRGASTARQLDSQGSIAALATFTLEVAQDLNALYVKVGPHVEGKLIQIIVQHVTHSCSNLHFQLSEGFGFCCFFVRLRCRFVFACILQISNVVQILYFKLNTFTTEYCAYYMH